MHAYAGWLIWEGKEKGKKKERKDGKKEGWKEERKKRKSKSHITELIHCISTGFSHIPFP